MPYSPSSSRSFLARLGTSERAAHSAIGDKADIQGQRRGTCQYQYGGAKFGTPLTMGEAEKRGQRHCGLGHSNAICRRTNRACLVCAIASHLRRILL